MDLFDIAVASKLAGGGGGGGSSSDLTTAKVTFGDVRIKAHVAMCLDIPQEYGLGVDGAVNFLTPGETPPEEITVPLYKGGAFAEFTSSTGTITTSGNIMAMGGNLYLITGDCTITIS